MSLHRRRIVSLALSVALHAAVFTVLVLLPPQRNPLGPAADQRTVAIVYVPEPGDPSPADAIAEGQELDDGVSPETFGLPGFTFDVARIRARQDALFPFLTGDLSALDAVRAGAAARTASLTWGNPSAPPRSRSGLPPLQLTGAEMMNLVDNAWSRRERWRNFVEIATLVTEHDPDEGLAPELLRTHLDENLLQPYYDAATRDPRFWVMLNLAADHTLVLNFVSRFIRDHPSTRSSTELLFLLDELVQASRDALLMLMATEPDRDLTLTRNADPDAYGLAVQLRERYGTWLIEHGLNTATDIRRHYDGIRMRILSTIIDTTPAGYGAADARYLAGLIMWDQNNAGDAVRHWREIGPDARGMYEPVYSGILREIQSPTGARAARISAILGADYRQWLEFSARRLSEFGYTVDSF